MGCCVWWWCGGAAAARADGVGEGLTGVDVAAVRWAAAVVVRGAGLNARPEVAPPPPPEVVVAPALAAATASKVAAAPAKGVEGRPLSRLRSEPCSWARVRERARGSGCEGGRERSARVMR